MEQTAGAQVPRLRGMLHAGALPAVIAACFMLVALAPSQQARLAAAVYGMTSAALFGVSAAYHRSRPATRIRGLLRRLDHASILLIIAGTYTPMAVLTLRGSARLGVLAVVWAAAAGGMAYRLIYQPTWPRAPRWLYTSLYVALGWVAIAVLPQFLHAAGVTVFVLVLVGGILYSAGGIVYARRRPDPSPTWFGFHEVFHALTVAAYLAQFVAVSLVVYRAA